MKKHELCKIFFIQASYCQASSKECGKCRKVNAVPHAVETYLLLPELI